MIDNTIIKIPKTYTKGSCSNYQLYIQLKEIKNRQQQPSLNEPKIILLVEFAITLLIFCFSIIQQLYFGIAKILSTYLAKDEILRNQAEILLPSVVDSKASNSVREQYSCVALVPVIRNTRCSSRSGAKLVKNP